MKKIYFAPSTRVVKIELQKMVANSPNKTILDKNDAPITDGNEIGSRRGNIWFDDEED